MPPVARLNELCIDGDTIIPLLNNEKKKIKDLVGKKNFCVQSIDLKTKEIVSDVVENVSLSCYSECLKITLDNEKTLIVAPNYKMMDVDGEFIEAKLLKVNSILLGCNTESFQKLKPCVVTNIELLNDSRPMYNIITKSKTCALDAGVFIKNSTGHG